MEEMPTSAKNVPSNVIDLSSDDEDTFQDNNPNERQFTSSTGRSILKNECFQNLENLQMELPMCTQTVQNETFSRSLSHNFDWYLQDTKPNIQHMHGRNVPPLCVNNAQIQNRLEQDTLIQVNGIDCTVPALLSRQEGLPAHQSPSARNNCRSSQILQVSHQMLNMEGENMLANSVSRSSHSGQVQQIENKVDPINTNQGLQVNHQILPRHEESIPTVISSMANQSRTFSQKNGFHQFWKAGEYDVQAALKRPIPDGNGFKTSTMRLGADAIVFSRSARGSSCTQSIGLLSYTFLRKTGQDDVVVPMVDYELQLNCGIPTMLVRSTKDDWLKNLTTILQWSPYATETELMKQFEDIGPHGTKIVIYNLWLNDDGILELDFDTDKEVSVATTIGFTKEAPLINVHGFNVYHKNRLIMPFWKVWQDNSSRGRGVVGVLEANFIEPAHDKQDFERTAVLLRLESRLKQMTVDYWKSHCTLIGYQASQKSSAQIQHQDLPSVQNPHPLASVLPGVLPRQISDNPGMPVSAMPASNVQIANGKETQSVADTSNKLVDKLCDENIQLFMRCEQHRQRESELNQMIMKLENELKEARTKFAVLVAHVEAQKKQRLDGLSNVQSFG